MKKRSFGYILMVVAAVAMAVLAKVPVQTTSQGDIDQTAVARSAEDEGDIHYFDEEAVALAGEPSSPEMIQHAEQTLAYVNQKRAAAGLPELQWSDALAQAAMVRAQECESKFSHTRPNGTDWYTVNSQIMYGENLAHNYYNAESVVNAWMDSPTHRANIEGNAFGTVGVAAYQTGSGQWYWAQEFGT